MFDDNYIRPSKTDPSLRVLLRVPEGYIARSKDGKELHAGQTAPSPEGVLIDGPDANWTLIPTNEPNKEQEEQQPQVGPKQEQTQQSGERVSIPLELKKAEKILGKKDFETYKNLLTRYAKGEQLSQEELSAIGSYRGAYKRLDNLSQEDLYREIGQNSDALDNLFTEAMGEEGRAEFRQLIEKYNRTPEETAKIKEYEQKLKDKIKEWHELLTQKGSQQEVKNSSSEPKSEEKTSEDVETQQEQQPKVNSVSDDEFARRVLTKDDYAVYLEAKNKEKEELTVQEKGILNAVNKHKKALMRVMTYRDYVDYVSNNPILSARVIKDSLTPEEQEERIKLLVDPPPDMSEDEVEERLQYFANKIDELSHKWFSELQATVISKIEKEKADSETETGSKESAASGDADGSDRSDEETKQEPTETGQKEPKSSEEAEEVEAGETEEGEKGGTTDPSVSSIEDAESEVISNKIKNQLRLGIGIPLRKLSYFVKSRDEIKSKVGVEQYRIIKRTYIHSRLGMEFARLGVKFDNLADYIEKVTELDEQGNFKYRDLLASLYRELGHETESHMQADEYLSALADPLNRKLLFAFQPVSIVEGITYALDYNKQAYGKNIEFKNETEEQTVLPEGQNANTLDFSEFEKNLQPQVIDYVPPETIIDPDVSEDLQLHVERARQAYFDALQQPGLTNTEKMALLSSLISLSSDGKSAELNTEQLLPVLTHFFHKLRTGSKNQPWGKTIPNQDELFEYITNSIDNITAESIEFSFAEATPEEIYKEIYARITEIPINEGDKLINQKYSERSLKRLHKSLMKIAFMQFAKNNGITFEKGVEQLTPEVVENYKEYVKNNFHIGKVLRDVYLAGYKPEYLTIRSAGPFQNLGRLYRAGIYGWQAMSDLNIVVNAKQLPDTDTVPVIPEGKTILQTGDVVVTTLPEQDTTVQTEIGAKGTAPEENIGANIGGESINIGSDFVEGEEVPVKKEGTPIEVEGSFDSLMNGDTMFLRIPESGIVAYTINLGEEGLIIENANNESITIPFDSDDLNTLMIGANTIEEVDEIFNKNLDRDIRKELIPQEPTTTTEEGRTLPETEVAKEPVLSGVEQGEIKKSETTETELPTTPTTTPTQKPKSNQPKGKKSTKKEKTEKTSTEPVLVETVGGTPSVPETKENKPEAKKPEEGKKATGSKKTRLTKTNTPLPPTKEERVVSENAEQKEAEAPKTTGTKEPKEPAQVSEELTQEAPQTTSEPKKRGRPKSTTGPKNKPATGGLTSRKETTEETTPTTPKPPKKEKKAPTKESEVAPDSSKQTETPVTQPKGSGKFTTKDGVEYRVSTDALKRPDVVWPAGLTKFIPGANQKNAKEKFYSLSEQEQVDAIRKFVEAVPQAANILEAVGLISSNAEKLEDIPTNEDELESRDSKTFETRELGKGEKSSLRAQNFDSTAEDSYATDVSIKENFPDLYGDYKQASTAINGSIDIEAELFDDDFSSYNDFEKSRGVKYGKEFIRSLLKSVQPNTQWLKEVHEKFPNTALYISRTPDDFPGWPREYQAPEDLPSGLARVGVDKGHLWLNAAHMAAVEKQIPQRDGEVVLGGAVATRYAENADEYAKLVYTHEKAHHIHQEILEAVALKKAPPGASKLTTKLISLYKSVKRQIVKDLNDFLTNVKEEDLPAEGLSSYTSPKPMSFDSFKRAIQYHLEEDESGNLIPEGVATREFVRNSVPRKEGETEEKFLQRIDKGMLIQLRRAAHYVYEKHFKADMPVVTTYALTNHYEFFAEIFTMLAHKRDLVLERAGTNPKIAEAADYVRELLSLYDIDIDKL